MYIKSFGQYIIFSLPSEITAYTFKYGIVPRRRKTRQSLDAEMTQMLHDGKNEFVFGATYRRGWAIGTLDEKVHLEWKLNIRKGEQISVSGPYRIMIPLSREKSS